MEKNKAILTLLIAVIISVYSIFAATAGNSVNPGETRISLNGLWNFKADYYNNGEAQSWFEGRFNDSGWDKLPVPGNWDIRNEYANYSGKGWYRTTFETPSEITDKVVRLNFEAVGIDYKVWVNDELVADVKGGYFPNFIDIGKKLKNGVKNSLAVCVDNTFRSGAYWSWGGIRRPVTLFVNNPVFIKSAHITATPDLKRGTAAVSLNVVVFNESQIKGNASLDYELSFAGKIIKTGNTTLTLSGLANQNASLEFVLAKKEVKLWHFDFPNLYSLKVQLKRGSNLYHEINERFGIRKAEIVNGLFLLNGESVRAMGLNWVADDRLTGNTLPAELYKREIDNMKSLGVNIARISHLPLPQEVYDYFDEKGIMIIAEIPVWGVTKLADPENSISKSWMKQLVVNNFNHPCIIGWCVGNEIGRKDQNLRVMEYVERAIKYVKDSLDHSRLVVMVSHTANSWKVDPSKFGDFVPYNTYGSWGYNADKVHEYQLGKMIFISECGSNLIGEDLNTSTGNFTKMLTEFRGREYLFGASLWTYNDYRSNFRSSDLTWDSKVSQNRDWGLIDGYGNKKRAFEIIRKEFAPLQLLKARKTETGIEVTLQPRGKLDLPAYVLREYRLVCEEYGPDYKSSGKSEITLPVINPGDPQLTKLFDVKSAETAVSARKISVISPTNYVMIDTTIYYATPEKPVIKAIFNNGSRMRVVFDHVNFAAEYRLQYGEKDLNQKSVNTIDRYIEVDKLAEDVTSGKIYKVQLVAINNFGETTSGFGNLPPVIKAVKAFQNGISIGYSSSKSEYLYKVQFSTSPDFSSDTHIVQTTSKGACYIPDLKPGLKYYVRMSVYEQFELQSPWSEVWSVTL